MLVKIFKLSVLQLFVLCCLQTDSAANDISELQGKIISSCSHVTTEPQLNSNPESQEKLVLGDIITDITLFKDVNPIRETTREELLNDVNRSWDSYESSNLELQPVIAKELYENALFDKVNDLLIPQVRFVNTPLSRVIESLASISEKNDTTSVDGEKGVNLVLLRDDTSSEPIVNLNLKNISLYKVIELVAKSVSYQFDITKDAVIFYKQNMGDDIIETQFFPISRATLVKLTGMQGINHHMHKNFGSSETIADEEKAIKDFFQRAGISFKDVPGSNLAFDGSQIIVTNSSRSLKKISNILKKYSEVKQVEIETKFLEVQQGALDELGFRWQFNSNNSPDKHFLQTGKTVDNKKYDNLRTLVESFASNNFSSGDGKIVQADAAPLNITNKSPGIPGQINLGLNSIPLSNFTGVLDSLQFNVMIQALEQHTGSDLMSAPKLTVLSGKTAEIVVAMELRYPQNYGDTHSEVGTGSSLVGTASSAGVTITSGTPQDFTTRNVGVEMSVTPVVEVDNSISLQLEPKVTEFEGFVEYGGVNVAVSSGTTVTVPSGFYQPIFSTREIHTEVNISDGATVVMGGLTREEVKEVNDKVPILGDIPLLGKLFRSKSETTQKRNLLIFVTAHTISPTGSKKLLRGK